MSKCGFPALEVNDTNIDVTVINQAGGNENTVDDLPDNSTLSAADAAVATPANGKISYTSGNPTTKDATCGKMRKMFVTITNIAPPTTPARLLQTSAPIAVSFSATDGPAATTSGAVSMIMNACIVLISLLYFAF